MYLYLVQHGRAKTDEEDPRRPLSDAGQEELSLIKAFLRAHRIIEVDKIFHSGKLRAEQTAAILADGLKPTQGTERADGLASGDIPAIWADRISEMYQNTMLVGHLPHLSRLASLLLTGDADLEPVDFRNSGIVCLGRGPDRRWTIDWIITPQILA